MWAEPVTFTVDRVDLVAVTQDVGLGRFSWNTVARIELPSAARQASSVLWNKMQPGEAQQKVGEAIAVEEAEYAAAGVRRLTVLHGLNVDQADELDALKTYVVGICHLYGIEPFGDGPETYTAMIPAQTIWRFGPPKAVNDIALVRAALAERYPHWPTLADDY